MVLTTTHKSTIKARDRSRTGPDRLFILVKAAYGVAEDTRFEVSTPVVA